MFIQYYRGQGYRAMNGVKEYIVLFQEEPTALEIEESCSHGFQAVRTYNTDIPQDYDELPLETPLVPNPSRF